MYVTCVTFVGSGVVAAGHFSRGDAFGFQSQILFGTVFELLFDEWSCIHYTMLFDKVFHYGRARYAVSNAIGALEPFVW